MQEVDYGCLKVPLRQIFSLIASCFLHLGTFLHACDDLLTKSFGCEGLGIRS